MSLYLSGLGVIGGTTLDRSLMERRRESNDPGRSGEGGPTSPK